MCWMYNAGIARPCRQLMLNSLARHQFSTVSEAAERERLSSYTGGSVDLSLDRSSGIATVTLDNPEKRNAMSGGLQHYLSSREIMYRIHIIPSNCQIKY